MKSATLHFPDYTLPWTLRCDASTVACGGTLLQVRESQVGKPADLEVIAFVSKKFSGAAQRWDIPKKEAYAIYFSVKELAYYLEVKEFVIETDHANLQWIEKAEAAIIVRWRLYLQNFSFKIKHIPGKANIFADMLSRMYMSSGQATVKMGKLPRKRNHVLPLWPSIRCLWELPTTLLCSHQCLSVSD